MAVAVECRLPNCSSRLIGNEQFVSVLVEGEAVRHYRLRTVSVGGITRRWCHGYRTIGQRTDITPYTANSISIEINCVCHRLDTKYFFTAPIGIHCVFTHTTPRCNLPNSSLSRYSVTNSEVSLLVEGDPVGSRNA